MKTKLKTILLLTFSLTLLAFKSGDMVELKAFLKARSSAEFTKTSANVARVLKKGTTGEILEVKKMPSGNFGLKIKVENGPNANEIYWVYYNLKNPAMDIFDKSNLKIDSSKIEEAKKNKLTKDQAALMDQESSSLIEAAQTAKNVLTQNAKTLEITSSKSPCLFYNPAALESVSEADYSETSLVAPYREKATSSLQSKSCRSHQNGYDICRNSQGQIESFQLSNNGPNAIVKSNEYYINRSLSFELEDRARSDLKLLVVDSPDDTTSHSTYSAMIFLPRKVLPSIKKVGNELEVTLPTKEVVKFNSQTKEIVSGVLKEGPMEQDERKKAKPANIKYQGDGVLIRTDKSGDLPHGDIELMNGLHAPSVSIATISKRGHKDCKIPAKEIWYTDYDKGANVFIMPELATDQGMDQFIKRKCGFSIF